MGRPKKYTSDVIEEIRLKMESYIESVDIPIVAEFAYLNKIPRQTLYVFTEESDEFSDTIKVLIDKKESQLERLALSKDINSSMAIFSLKQLGWSDKQEIEHSGNMGVTLIDDIK